MLCCVVSATIEYVTGRVESSRVNHSLWASRYGQLEDLRMNHRITSSVVPGTVSDLDLHVSRHLKICPSSDRRRAFVR